MVHFMEYFGKDGMNVISKFYKILEMSCDDRSGTQNIYQCTRGYIEIPHWKLNGKKNVTHRFSIH